MFWTVLMFVVFDVFDISNPGVREERGKRGRVEE